MGPGNGKAAEFIPYWCKISQWCKLVQKFSCFYVHQNQAMRAQGDTTGLLLSLPSTQPKQSRAQTQWRKEICFFCLSSKRWRSDGSTLTCESLCFSSQVEKINQIIQQPGHVDMLVSQVGIKQEACRDKRLWNGLERPAWRSVQLCDGYEDP